MFVNGSGRRHFPMWWLVVLVCTCANVSTVATMQQQQHPPVTPGFFRSWGIERPTQWWGLVQGIRNNGVTVRVKLEIAIRYRVLPTWLALFLIMASSWVATRTRAQLVLEPSGPNWPHLSSPRSRAEAPYQYHISLFCTGWIWGATGRPSVQQPYKGA